MEQKKNNFPEVKLGQYKGLAVTRRVRPVTDRVIHQEMVHRTRLRASYRPSTAPAKLGNRVQIDFVGFMNDEEIPNSRMEKVMVVLGDGKLMPAAEKAICGHCAGETFRFDFTYPEEFRVEELSGKTAQFEIRLHSVAEKQTPELNEEFAKAEGFDSLDAMREAVRKDKQAIHEAGADRTAGMKLLEQAGANLTVSISAETLDRAAANDMKALKSRLSRSGLTIEQHAQNSHTTPEAIEKGYRDTAEMRIRTMLAAKAIAEAEHIVVTHPEVENEYLRLSQLHDTPLDEIRKVLTEDTVATALAAQKVQRFLLENAVVTTITDTTDTSEKE